MPPNPVVKDLDVFENTLPSFCSGPIFRKINDLRFERVKERFHDSVIIAIAFAAHAL